MLGYIIRRFIRMAIVLWVVTFFLFILMRWIPGDIAAVRLGDMATPERLAALRHELGTDRPLLTQYWDWFSGIFRGDFGESLMTGESVGSIVKRSLPITLELSLMAWIIGSVIGVIPGIICAVKQDTFWDYSIRVVTIVLLGVPSFWLALLSLVYWWTPPLIFKDFLDDPLYNLKQFILPALCISISSTMSVFLSSIGSSNT